jgi:hypothetical protein
VHIEKRENPIINRLNKTKLERAVDHEQERIERVKKETARKRAEAAESKKASELLSRQRAEEKASRSYDLISEENELDEEGNQVGARRWESSREAEEDFM